MSDDILSGGTIDESTSGPIPPAQDTRSSNIIAEQVARMDQEAIGGSQFPPMVEPLPPIPEPQYITPLPDTRETARQAVVDTLKKVTIDGQGPVIEGSSISFNTARRSTASEDFGTMGNANFNQPYLPSRLDDPNFGSKAGGSDFEILQRTSRLNDSDFGTRKGAEDNSTRDAYAAAEARREERKKSDPDFDKTSDTRQKGETMDEYKTRLQEFETAERAAGPIAVSLNRADGQGKVFALFKSESSKEGEPDLPTSEYYVGGGDASIHPFKIYSRVNNGTPEVKVESASSVYSGFGSFSTTAITGLDSWTGASQGYVVVVAEVSAGGSVTSQEILWGQGSLGSRITFSEETQTGYNFPIAYLYFEGTVLKIRQLAFTDKTLVTVCVDGKGAVYPISA